MRAPMCALVLLFLAAAVQAAELSGNAQGLRTSSFSDDGRLIRKFEAQSATGPFASPVVERGKVEFFDENSGDRAVALLEWARAKFLRADEVIVGDERIQLSTAEGIVSGVGFRCSLQIGRLDLRSKVNFSSADFRISGNEAVVEFEAKGKKKNEVIQRIAITGNIVVERTATAKAPFDRAETGFARYSAEENKLFLKTPVLAWRKGERTEIETLSEYLEIDLGDKESGKAPEAGLR